jgi:hypothetical protein
MPVKLAPGDPVASAATAWQSYRVAVIRGADEKVRKALYRKAADAEEVIRAPEFQARFHAKPSRLAPGKTNIKK